MDYMKKHPEVRAFGAIMLLLIAVFAAMLIIYQINPGHLLLEDSRILPFATYTAPITSDCEVTQTFKCKFSRVDKIRIKILSNDSGSSSTLSVRLEDLTDGMMYESQLFNTVDSLDDSLCINYLPEVQEVDLTGHTFRIVITSPDATEETAIKLMTGFESTTDDGVMTIDGAETGTDISFSVCSYDTSAFMFLLVCTIFLAFGFLTYMIVFRKMRFELISLLFVLILGIAFMIARVPFSWEGSVEDYNNTLVYSNKLCLASDENKVSSKYYDVEYFRENTFDGYSTLIMYNVLDHGDASESVQITAQRGADTWFVGYVPQTVGITFARFFGANFLTAYYMGCLLNLLLYALCVFLAVKLIPKFKIMVLLIMSLPTFLSAAASFSQFALITGLQLVAIAMLIRMIYVNKEIIPLNIVLPLVLIALTVPVSPVFALPILLLMLIPKKRFNNRILLYSLTGGLTVIGIVVSVLMNAGAYVPLEDNAGFFAVFAHAFSSFAQETKAFVCGGTSADTLSGFVLMLYLIPIFCSALVIDGEKLVIKASHRALYIAIAVLGYLFLAARCAWFGYSDGISGGNIAAFSTSLAPFATLLFISFNNKNVHFIKNPGTGIIIGSMVLQMITIMQLIGSFI